MDWWIILMGLASALFIGLLIGRGSTDVLRARIEMLELQLKGPPPKPNPKAWPKFHPNRVEVKREAIPVLDAVETGWQEYRSGEPHLIVRDPDLILKILDMVEKKPKRPWSDPPRPKK